MEDKPAVIHNIVFLRHGLSTANENGIIQGQQNYPLSEAGYLQAKNLGTCWREEGIKFDHIITSPLERARATAGVIADHLGTEIVVDELWLERQLGEAQGKTYTSLQQTRGDLIPSPYEPPFQGAESEWDLYLRAAQAVQSLFLNDPGQLLIVSHGALLSSAMRTILGQPPAAGRVRPARFSFDNTGHSHLSYNRISARWTLHYHNKTTHLEGQAGQK